MSNQIFYVDKQKYEIPQDKVESFLQYFGDKAIPLDKMPKTSYQISTGEIFEIPYGLDKDFLSYPGYENAIKITENSNPPVPGFTNPNPAQFPGAALNGTSDNNVNAPLYDKLQLQQQEILNASAIQVPYSVFDPEGKDYDETTARRVERAVGGMYDPMTQHWASLDPQTGMLLKGINHPSIQETLDREAELGNEIIKKEDGRYYSVPKTNKSWDSSIHGVDSTKEDRTRNWTKKYGINPEELGELLSGYEDGGGPEKFGTFDEYLDLAFGTKDPEEKKEKIDISSFIKTDDFAPAESTGQNIQIGEEGPVPQNMIQSLASSINTEIGAWNEAFNQSFESIVAGKNMEKSLAPIAEYFDRFRDDEEKVTDNEILANIGEGATNLMLMPASMASEFANDPITFGKHLLEFFAIENVKMLNNLITATNLNPIVQTKIAMGDPEGKKELEDARQKIARYPLEHVLAPLIGKQSITAPFKAPGKVKDMHQKTKAYIKADKSKGVVELSKEPRKTVSKEELSVSDPKDVVGFNSQKIKEFLSIKKRKGEMLSNAEKLVDAGIPYKDLKAVANELGIKPTTGKSKIDYANAIADVLSKKQLGTKEGVTRIELLMKEGKSSKEIKKILKEDPEWSHLTVKELKFVDDFIRSEKKQASELTRNLVENLEKIEEAPIRRLKDEGIPVPKKIKKAEVIESEVPIVDGKGNPVIARFNEKTKKVEINPKEFNKLSEKEQIKVIRHEQGHSLYDQLSKKEQKAVKDAYENLSQAEKDAFNKQFPTQKGYEHTEFYAQLIANEGKLNIKTKGGSTKGAFKFSSKPKEKPKVDLKPKVDSKPKVDPKPKIKPKNEVKMTKIEGQAYKNSPKGKVPKNPGFKIDGSGKITVKNKGKALDVIRQLINDNLNRRQTPKIMADGRALRRIEKKIENLKIHGKRKELLEQQIKDRELREAIREIHDVDALLESDIAHESVRKRRGFIGEESLKMADKIEKINKKYTPEERTLATFLIEGAGLPKVLKNTKIGKLYKDPKIRKKLEPLIEDMRRSMKDLEKLDMEAFKDMSPYELDNYVSHIWDLTGQRKGVRSEISDWFTTRNRFTKKRYIDTLVEGMDKFNLRAKTLDIGEILAIRHAASVRALANKRFLEEIKSIRRRVEVEPGKLPAGEKPITELRLTLPAKEAPSSWKKVDHPAFTTPTGVPLKVHPDIAKHVKAVLDMPEPAGRLLGAYDAIGGLMKKTNLSLSLFHHLALTESVVGALPARTIYKQISPRRIIFEGFLKGEKFAFKKLEIARDAVRNGLQLGASHDIPVADINSIIRGLVNKTDNKFGKLSGMNAVFRGAEVFNKRWDTALWDYLHDGYKLLTYEHLVAKLPPELTKSQRTMRKREIAARVNDMYGGQHWDILGKSPSQVKNYTRLLLSPDWLVSTTRQVYSITGAIPIPKRYKIATSGQTARYGAGVSLGMLVRGGIKLTIALETFNRINRYFDKKENPEYYKRQVPEDKGFWRENLSIQNNAPGKTTSIFIGRYPDGTEMYAKPLKQYKEVPELFLDKFGNFDPLQFISKIGGKANPLLSLGIQTMTGSTPSKFKNRKIGDKAGWERFWGTVDTWMSSPFPFSSRQAIDMFRDYALGKKRDPGKAFHPLQLMMPISKGTSYYTANKLFLNAMEASDTEAIRRIYNSLIQNGKPAGQWLESAKSDFEKMDTAYKELYRYSISELQEKIKNAKSAGEREMYDDILIRKTNEEIDIHTSGERFESIMGEVNKIMKYKDANPEGE